MDTTKMERFSKFISRHKTTIAYTAGTAVTLAACIVVNRMANNDMINFIKEHNLYEEYLTAGEE